MLIHKVHYELNLFLSFLNDVNHVETIQVCDAFDMSKYLEFLSLNLMWSQWY